jgi:hypothetical protein
MLAPAQTYASFEGATGGFRPNGVRAGPACRLHARVRRPYIPTNVVQSGP